MLGRLQIITLWLLYLNNVTAQTYTHHTLRSNFGVQKELFTDSYVLLEYQHRRQDNPNTSPYNIFNNHYQQSIRVWFRYDYEDKLELMVSPFAYFRNWKFLTRDDDLPEIDRDELRFAVQTEFFQRIGKFRAQSRNAYEYRIFYEDNQVDYEGRFRSRQQVQYRIKEPLRINFHNEIFINTLPGSPATYFNQNRTVASMVHHTDWYRLEIGYIFIFRQRESLVEYDEEHGLVVGFVLKI